MERFSEKLKHEIPIIDYAARLGFTLVRKGRYYSLKEHDSVMIDTEKNCFWRNSRFSKGFAGGSGSVIDFAIEFADAGSASDAMRQLSNMYGIHGENDQIKTLTRPKDPLPSREQSQKRSTVLKLPKKNNNTDAVFDYLKNERMIEKNIILYFFEKKMLYQDLRQNCVFHTDDFGCLRSTAKSRFVGDLEGSNYDECFYFGSTASGKLIVAESVIDIMSIMSFLAIRGKTYKDHCYLALAGTNKLESVFYHLKKEGDALDSVYLCLDNDPAGHTAVSRISSRIQSDCPEISIIVEFPPQGKDWNDYIKIIKSSP